MKGFVIFALMVAYALCVMFRLGGHYVHILPAVAMVIYVVGLFNYKSAGVGSS